jgi:hypothetical protein
VCATSGAVRAGFESDAVAVTEVVQAMTLASALRRGVPTA